jgi:DNA-binding NarL/FixJ family response regulator
MKKLLIADDHSYVRQALRAVFDSQSDITICAEATNGQEVIENAVKVNPDLILMDMSMPVLNGLDAAHALKRIMPEVPIILFTAYKSKFVEACAAASGVDACVAKGDDASCLLGHARGLLSRPEP